MEKSHCRNKANQIIFVWNADMSVYDEVELLRYICMSAGLRISQSINRTVTLWSKTWIKCLSMSSNPVEFDFVVKETGICILNWQLVKKKKKKTVSFIRFDLVFFLWWILSYWYTKLCSLLSLQAEELKADLDRVIQNKNEGPGFPPSEPPFDIRSGCCLTSAPGNMYLH